MSSARDGDFELVTLRSGARAVRHLGHGEVMHPALGPWEEAKRLYAEQLEVPRRLAEETSEPLRVLDVGLGAAANAAAILSCARALPGRRPLELHSLELDLAPLRLAVADPEGFPFLAPWRPAVEALMSLGRWESGGISWTLALGDLRQTLERAPRAQDLVLFDPFSPRASPELWTPEVLGQIRALCRVGGEGALLATYSAATPTRVSLLLAGFFVGAGLSTGSKQETTLAATRRASLTAPLGERWLARWRRSSARGPHGASLTEALEARVLGHPQFSGESSSGGRPPAPPPRPA